jgi:hypothetical protein
MTQPTVQSAALLDQLAGTIGPSRVVAALFSTFTFRREFFETVPLTLITAEGRRRGLLPITVVVDRMQFEGKGWGYEVVRAPAGRRWHAKLVAVMVEEDGHPRTVIGIGSGNLTRSGWERNLELFHVDSWPGWRLPARVIDWLTTPWPRTSHFAAWARENRVVAKRRDHRSVLSSLEEPLWHQLDFVRQRRSWSDVHIVSPFGDIDGDEVEAANGCGPFFNHLLESTVAKSARMTVYLREADTPDTASGDPAILRRVGNRVKLQLRAVPRDSDRTLHAKLLATRTHGNWSVVIGSPNATGPAFVTSEKNVELACEFPHVGRVLPPGLLPRSYRIRVSDVRRPKVPEPKLRWECLEWAAYEPRRKRIVLRWKSGHGPFDSRILLADRDLDPNNVDLGAMEDRFLKTIPRDPKKGRSYEPDFVPIDVPHDEADIRDDTAFDKLTAEDWLSRLDSSAAPGETSATGERGRVGANGHQNSPNPHSFHWRERVVMLTEKLRGFDAAIGEARTKREINQLRKLALGVWRSHNPDERSLTSVDRSWRRWVRAGLWQVLHRLDRRIALWRPLSDLAVRWNGAVARRLREFDIV